MSAPRIFATVFALVFGFAMLAYLGGPLLAGAATPAEPEQTEPVSDTLSADGGFACGPRLACNRATQYCMVVTGGPKGTPPGHSCVDVSDVTSAPSCETIPDIGIGCECAESDGAVTVTCSAP